MVNSNYSVYKDNDDNSNNDRMVTKISCFASRLVGISGLDVGIRVLACSATA